MTARNVCAHVEREHRYREHESRPEPPRHVGKLRIGATVWRCQLRLERHSANRTSTGSDLMDIRMHGAGVDRTRRHMLRDAFGGRKVRVRLAREFCTTSSRAEVIG